MLKQAWTFSPLIEWTARDFANAVPVAEKYRLTKLCPRNPVFHWARATIGGGCRRNARDALQEFAPSLQPTARETSGYATRTYLIAVTINNSFAGLQNSAEYLRHSVSIVSGESGRSKTIAIQDPPQIPAELLAEQPGAR